MKGARAITFQRESSFWLCDLTDTSFESARGDLTSFSACKLNGANLKEAYFGGSYFSEYDLSRQR